MRWLVIGAFTAVLLAVAAPGAVAHKGKLPEDALTLVRQAAALLAQNPGMVGEVRERLQAALKSKKPQGVHLDQVTEALRALERKDLPSARRLALASIMPAGMAMPPTGPGRPARPSPAPPPSALQMPAAPPIAVSAEPPSVEVAMKMTEPLRARFTRSPVEVTVLVLGLALMSFGLGALRRGRERQP